MFHSCQQYTCRTHVHTHTVHQSNTEISKTVQTSKQLSNHHVTFRNKFQTIKQQLIEMTRDFRDTHESGTRRLRTPYSYSCFIRIWKTAIAHLSIRSMRNSENSHAVCHQKLHEAPLFQYLNHIDDCCVFSANSTRKLKNSNKLRNNPQLQNEQTLSVRGSGKQLTNL